MPRRRRPSRAEMMARDEAVIERLGELGEAMCSVEEVTQILGLTEAGARRLFERFARPRAAYLGGRARTLEALRRAQVELARTNAAMAIKLGRTYLGQGDDKEAETDEAIDVAEVGRRVRAKVARLAAAEPPTGDREGD